MLRALLAACASAAFAYEVSPVPGGAHDGGRDGVRITAHDGDVEVGAATVSVPASGMSAFYAMKRSSVAFDSIELGGKSVVTAIAGVAAPLPGSHAWVLTHGEAATGESWPNVNLAETVVRPGDSLEWRRLRLGSQPTPRVRAPRADAPAPAVDDEDASEL